MAIIVPNQMPVVDKPEKIALIGGSPGKDETEMRMPFVGGGGNILSQLLNRAGILKSACFLGNIAQSSPTYGNEDNFSWDGWQVQQGLEQLGRDIKAFDPNVCVLMGKLAMRAAGKTGDSVYNMRGTMFRCVDTNSPLYGRKCIITHDPYILTGQYKLVPLVAFDLKRAAEEALDKDLELPQRTFDLHLTPPEIMDKLDSWPTGHVASIDIEGGVNPEKYGGITCLSIASSPQYAFIIDFKNMSPPVMLDVYKSLKRWMENPEIPKIAQNFMYENFCIPWRHKMYVAGMHWDTMLSGWEIFPELPKSLATQTSIWTREPYYKFERKIHDDETHNAYCCKDTTVTYEIYERQKEYLDQEEFAQAKAHLDFNHSLLRPFAYMQLRGIKYESELAQSEASAIWSEMMELQTWIDLVNGEPLNINSHVQLKKFLYNKLQLTKQYVIEKGRKTNKLASDVVALLKLLKLHDSDVVYHILRWRHLEGIRRQVDFKLDDDGRVRSGYNVVGTETGRLSCKTSDSGGGYNLQTTTKRLRKCFVPDEGNYMFQVDLSGADGWTVAAHCARFDDFAMLEDYRSGVKPAKVICALSILKDNSIATLPSHDLKEIIDGLDIPPWLYAAAKAVQHGSNYGMGGPTMSNNILKRSWKDDGSPVHVAPKDCLALQTLYFLRYRGVKAWQAWCKQQLEQFGWMDSASGHRRHFFGRRRDNATLQAAYSQEPQANTTYATNLALVNLWSDPDNRDKNKLVIEPLHQVHDALIGQFPKDKEDWAVKKLIDYFSNTLTIAGTEMIIPFEGEYGLYWGDDSAGTIFL